MPNCQQYKQLLETLTTDFTREIAWCLFSPDLVKEFTSPIELDSWAINWLKWLDTNLFMSDLTPFVKRPVGRRFEQILRFYFEQHPDWQLIAQNKVIEDNGITIGEIDFIVMRLSREEIYHLEVAAKFFLRLDDLYWGPNKNDRLDLKIDKLVKKQLKLTEQPAAQSWLVGLTIMPGKLLKRCHIKGLLFDKYNESDDNKQPFWMTHSTFKQLNHAKFAVISKEHWLTPTLPAHLPLNPDTHLTLTRPELLWCVYSLTDNEKHENQTPIRIFVCQDNWDQEGIIVDQH